MSVSMTILAAAAALTPDPEFAAKAQAVLDAAFAADAPGATAIIVEDGQTVFAGARGLADVDAGEALSPGDELRLGSITKQFTAAMIMKLVEEGDVDLQAPIGTYLADLPAAWSTVNVHQLLNHTSGIPSYTANADLMGNSEETARPRSQAEMVDLVRDKPLDFAPGSDWRYNNSGYVLLGAIIEKVTGFRWDKAIEQRLLAPAGVAGIASMYDEEALPEFATGYSRSEEGVVVARPIHGDLARTAGALVGDTAALSAWSVALHGGDIVSAASLARMATPTRTYEGKELPYGYGLELEPALGRRAIGHGGGIFGFSTYGTYLPDEELFVAVFANSDSPSVKPKTLTLRLAALALGTPLPDFSDHPIAKEDVADWLGVYARDKGERRLEWHENGVALAGDEFMVPLQSAGDGVLYLPPTESVMWLRLVREADGTPAIEWVDDGLTVVETTVRGGDLPEGPVFVDVASLDLTPLPGRYQWPMGVFTVTISEQGTLMGQLTGQGSFELKPVSQTEWHVPMVGAVLTFAIEDGTASALTLEQGGQSAEGPRLP